LYIIYRLFWIAQIAFLKFFVGKVKMDTGDACASPSSDAGFSPVRQQRLISATTAAARMAAVRKRVNLSI